MLLKFLCLTVPPSCRTNADQKLTEDERIKFITCEGSYARGCNTAQLHENITSRNLSIILFSEMYETHEIFMFTVRTILPPHPSALCECTSKPGMSVTENDGRQMIQCCL